MPAGQITHQRKMTRLTIKLVLGLTFINSICIGQTIKLDSCGLDTNPKLNKFEVAYLDNVLLADSGQDFKKGFSFTNKKIEFFTCDNEKSADGFLTKDKFFDILKESGPRRPRGIFILNDKQKKSAKQLDAIVLIDCKMYSEDDLMTKLHERKEKNIPLR